MADLNIIPSTAVSGQLNVDGDVVGGGNMNFSSGAGRVGSELLTNTDGTWQLGQSSQSPLYYDPSAHQLTLDLGSADEIGFVMHDFTNYDEIFKLGPEGELYVSPHMPTADPHVANQVWNNAGVLTVSAG